MEFIKKWLDRKETKKEINIIEKEIKILDNEKIIKTFNLTNKQYEIKKCEEIYQELQKNIIETNHYIDLVLKNFLQAKKHNKDEVLRNYSDGAIIHFLRILDEEENQQAKNQKTQSFLNKKAILLREELQQIQEELQIWKNLLDKRQLKLLTK